jgi:SAM-dependent methyltransferase
MSRASSAATASRGESLVGVFACPNDQHALSYASDRWHCPVCLSDFPEEDGVIRTLSRTDSFYEGAYLNRVHFRPRSERFIDAWPLWLIRNGLIWTVRKWVPPGATVLDLGCAGGVDYFGAQYRMIGCDLSMQSLRASALAYAKCVQADARDGLPVKQGTLDAVVSSFFWEHIPPVDKSRILGHLHASLTERGLLIFLYDIHTENPLITRYRERDPQKYQSVFLNADGHLGYQSLEDNRRIFEEAGYDVLVHRAMEKTLLQPPDVYEKLHRWKASRLMRLGSYLSRPPLNYAYIALLRMIDESIGRLLPERWGRIALTVCKRRDADA